MNPPGCGQLISLQTGAVLKKERLAGDNHSRSVIDISKRMWILRNEKETRLGEISYQKGNLLPDMLSIVHQQQLRSTILHSRKCTESSLPSIDSLSNQ